MISNKNIIEFIKKEIELSEADTSWHKIIIESLIKNLDDEYITSLTGCDFFPSFRKIFSPFKTPFESVKFILFGESPYPRVGSATGYSFIDGEVKDIWSDKGLSKKVNRATSLRNIIKTAMVAEGLVSEELNKEDIINLDKTNLSKTMEDIKDSFISNGFLLLNASPILREDRSKKVIRNDFYRWSGFYRDILKELDSRECNWTTSIVLWGGIAKDIESIYKPKKIEFIKMEHPYNISFISNPAAISLFSDISILSK